MDNIINQDTVKPTFRRPVEIGKSWGKEVISCNFPEYCGKLLVFNKNGKCSFHQHFKLETFLVLQGSFLFKYLDAVNADELERVINQYDIVDIPRMALHQMIALEDNSIIMETSTQDFENGSLRVWKGNGQQAKS